MSHPQKSTVFSASVPFFGVGSVVLLSIYNLGYDMRGTVNYSESVADMSKFQIEF